jgi:glutamyl-tRNA reductase
MLPIITQDLVKAVMKRRRGRDLFFVDVAVPRDVDERAGKLDGVYLYNVDDLSSVVAETQASRQDSAQHAERIVAEELTKLERSDESEQVTPTVRALYDWVGGVMRAEVDRSIQGNLKSLETAEREALARLVDAATKKLLHHPATTLKRWAIERPLELEGALELLHELFLPEATKAHSSNSSAAGAQTTPQAALCPSANPLAKREVDAAAAVSHCTDPNEGPR